MVPIDQSVRYNYNRVKSARKENLTWNSDPTSVSVLLKNDVLEHVVLQIGVGLLAPGADPATEHSLQQNKDGTPVQGFP